MRTIWKYKGNPVQFTDETARRLIKLKYVHVISHVADRMGITWLFGHKTEDRFGEVVPGTVSIWEPYPTTSPTEPVFGGAYVEKAFNGNTAAVNLAKVLLVPTIFLFLVLIAKLQYMM